MKNKTHIYLIIILIISILSGCAYSSNISKFNGGEGYFNRAPYIYKSISGELEAYTLYERASSGFVSIESVRRKAERRADLFASRYGKSVEVIGVNASEPPFILGNFPRVQIVFVLVDKK